MTEQKEKSIKERREVHVGLSEACAFLPGVYGGVCSFDLHLQAFAAEHSGLNFF